MKTKPGIAGENWHPDGSTIIVRIPMTWQRRGGRKCFREPDAHSSMTSPTEANARFAATRCGRSYILPSMPIAPTSG